MPRPIPDFLNKKYGRLLVVKDLGRESGPRKVFAICDCGKEGIFTWNSIQQSHTQSCGCYSHECSINNNKTHGLSKHPLFTVWSNMIQRCCYANHPQYYAYGGRGITVCEEWKNDFKAYYDWCIENGWEAGKRLSVDRIKNNQEYSPGNCRIATDVIQARNKRSNRIFIINGVSKCLKEWCIIYGLNYKLTHQKIFRDNNSLESIIQHAS